MPILLIDRSLPAPDVVQYESMGHCFDTVGQDIEDCTLINTDTGEVLHYDEEGQLKVKEKIIVEEE